MLAHLRDYLFKFSNEAYQAGQSLYYDKSPAVNLSLQRGFSLATEWPTLSLELAGAGEDPELFSEVNALDLGRQIATVVHCHFHLAFQRGLRQSGLYGPPSDPAGMLAAEERAYRMRLRQSRAMALDASVHGLNDLLLEIIEAVQTSLTVLVEQVAGLSREERGVEALGVRASQLARSYAMFSAALVYLRHRMVTGASIRGLKTVAERRQTTIRLTPILSSGSRDIRMYPPYTRLPVIAFLENPQWVDRPEIPYSKADVTDYGFEVRVHRKDMHGYGVCDGAWVWVKGKVEAEGDTPVLISEFEGPGQHSGDVWEDWLADEVRRAYDLYPGVMDMKWEYPDLDKLGSMYDLVSRIDDLLVDEEQDNG